MVKLAQGRERLELTMGYLALTESMVEHMRASGNSLGGISTQIQLNTLKNTSADEAFRVANDLIEVTGPDRGYRKGGLRLEQLMRDLRSATLNFSTDRLRLVTGRLSLMDLSVDLLGLRSCACSRLADECHNKKRLQA